MHIITKYLSSFLYLFYPRLCLSCETTLQGNEHVLCTWCMHSLPETGFQKSQKNPAFELLDGRLKLEWVYPLLFFDKGSKYRRILYQLKYKGRKEAGLFLGKLIGSRIAESELSTPDVLVPIPLHKTKLRRRGYNQSFVIAEGISSVLQIPVIPDALVRKSFTKTQTRKGRYDRWKNVEGLFACKKPDMLKNKHVLLIDDVITTGATLEAAATPILQLQGTKLSVATAAYTSH